MKAVVFHGIGDIRLDDVPDPQILESGDAIVRLTSSAICGTDLHMVRGTLPGMKEGTILRHEGVGIVEEVGADVRNLQKGDRVVIPSTIACGSCSYCREGYYAQCDDANPNGHLAGTSFYGGPKMTGPFNGLQAEYARVPYANIGLVKLPEEVSDDQAILASDIFPTGYFGADLAEIKPGRTVVVLGCGPVGQFAILSAFLKGAGRVIAVDSKEDRLAVAAHLGAEVVNFETEDPVDAVRQLTGGIGADRVIDAVGVDATHPSSRGEGGPDFEKEVKELVPETHPENGNWIPGNAPSQALQWAVEMVAKAGGIAIIGVYPPTDRVFPIGMAMNKNLTIRMGNCNHRKYIPDLVRMIRNGTVDPLPILSNVEPMTSVIDAYKIFDKRQPGWMKVALEL